MTWLEQCAEAGDNLFGPRGLLTRGKDPPPWYEKEPLMADWHQAQLYLNAFFDLSTCRPAGMGGILAIPWSTAVQYAHALGLDREDFRSFWLIIRDIDQRYVRRVNEEAEAARKGATANKPQVPGTRTKIQR